MILCQPHINCVIPNGSDMDPTFLIVGPDATNKKRKKTNSKSDDLMATLKIKCVIPSGSDMDLTVQSLGPETTTKQIYILLPFTCVFIYLLPHSAPSENLSFKLRKRVIFSDGPRSGIIITIIQQHHHQPAADLYPAYNPEGYRMRW